MYKNQKIHTYPVMIVCKREITRTYTYMHYLQDFLNIFSQKIATLKASSYTLSIQIPLLSLHVRLTSIFIRTPGLHSSCVPTNHRAHMPAGHKIVVEHQSPSSLIELWKCWSKYKLYSVFPKAVTVCETNALSIYFHSQSQRLFFLT